jgi:hypothetical protein
LKRGKAEQVTELGQVNDPGLYEKWLSKTTPVTRKSWDETVLTDQEHDCVVFFYSSENPSYQQRGYAYQFNLAMETVMEHEASSIISAIKFYSYDV